MHVRRRPRDALVEILRAGAQCLTRQGGSYPLGRAWLSHFCNTNRKKSGRRTITYGYRSTRDLNTDQARASIIVHERIVLDALLGCPAGRRICLNRERKISGRISKDPERPAKPGGRRAMDGMVVKWQVSSRLRTAITASGRTDDRPWRAIEEQDISHAQTSHTPDGQSHGGERRNCCRPGSGSILRRIAGLGPLWRRRCAGARGSLHGGCA